MGKTLALFDFDGTLYSKDSLLEFTRFHKGNRAFGLGIIKLFPYLSGLKLRLLDNEKVKLKYLTHFFKDADWDYFIAAAKDFATREIPKNLDKKVFENFKKHITDGHEVAIVTASAPQWIAPWADMYGVKVIGTHLETTNNKLTGKLTSANCFGPEKVNRIRQAIDLDAYDTIYVYGSGEGDREMLLLRKNA